MSKNEDEQLEPGCPPNAYLDKLLELRTVRPKDWNLLAPATKLSALHYEARRRRTVEEKEAQEGHLS